MNPNSLDEAKRIFRKIKNTAITLNHTDVIMCPPSIYAGIFLTKKSYPHVYIGFQDVHFEEQGAYTGEISPLMLRDLKADYVIIGHSERRAKGETDEIISKKIQKVLELNIKAVLCIGENQRDQNGLYLDFIKDQIKNSLNKVQKKNIDKLIIAYEPLWAIGAKEAMLSADIHEMTLFIKKVLSDLYGHSEAISTPVLYGGAVNFRNAQDIIVQGGVDGLLVGRESVNPPGFIELLKTIDLL